MMLLVVLALPVVAAMVSALPWGRRAAPLATIVAAGTGLVLCSFVAAQVAATGEVIAIPGWISCDGLAVIVAWLVSLVGCATAVFSWGHIEGRVPADAPGKLRRYYLGLNLFFLSLLAVPLLAQIALVWIAVAMTTLLSAFLVSFHGTAEALEAAWKYVVLTSLGALVALFGVFLLYWTAHRTAPVFTWAALDAAGAAMSSTATMTAFVFLLVGLGTKVGLVPLHTWLPDAYSQAPSPICALLSGVETTTALYVVIRVLAVCRRTGLDVGTGVVALGLLSTAVAVLLLLQATDIKRLFAYSTIEHMGIILVAAGLGTGDASLAAVYQMVGHALAKSFCFIAAGLVITAAGTREMRGIRGLLRASPLAGVSLLVGGLAISGVPPFAVFVGELSIINAGITNGEWASHYGTIALLALLIVIGFCAVMARINSMVFGDPPVGKTTTRFSRGGAIALGVLFVPLLAAGIWVPPWGQQLLTAAATTLGVQ